MKLRPVFIMCVLAILVCAASAHAGFYKFSGNIARITGHTQYLAPHYSAGDLLTFVFEIDETRQGFYTLGTGEIQSQPGSRYAEYLGGDALLLHEFDAYEPASTSVMEYNSVEPRTGTTYYSMLTQWYSNRINLKTDGLHYSDWKNAVGSSSFSLNQMISVGDVVPVTAAYFIDALTLVEYSDELSGLNLAGVAMLNQAATPIPGALWLLGTGLAGLAGIRRKMKV